jgi:hypothetical protein
LNCLVGDSLLPAPQIKIPKRGKIYSMNEANRWDWDKPLQVRTALSHRREPAWPRLSISVEYYYMFPTHHLRYLFPHLLFSEWNCSPPP